MTVRAPTTSSEVALTARLITLAAHARRRLAIQQWLTFIVRDLRWWFALVVLAALARLTGYGLPTWSVWLIPAWLVLIALIAWRKAPAIAGALARIDRALALDDLLLNAWDFSARSTNDSFVKEHLRRADERLPQLDAARALPVVLPLRHIAALVLISLLLVSGFLAPLPPALPVVLDERQRGELAAQANELAREAAKIPTTALEEAEKAKLDELQQRIREAQEQAKRQGLTQPEVLKELDRLAHRAEDLAALLDQSDSPNAALLSELERHADTADLATALRAGDLAKAAAEAKALSERLARKDLTLDERRRLEQALDRAAKAATGDRSATAEAVKQAQAAMQQGDPQQAGKALQKLAQNLAQRQQRQDAAKKMSALANRLRSTGSRLLSSPAGALSKLPPGARSSGAPLAANSLPPARFQPGSKPGSGNRPGNGTPSGKPAKGQGQGQGQGKGQGQGQASIPVPGTGNGNGAGGGAGGGAGSIPVPGSGAGTGHVKATGAATAPRTPAQTSTVTAASGEGHSEQVQVGGQVHDEGSARAVSQTPLTMVDAEERALDEDPLPAGRRAQVKAYFNLLREKLEP
jgi:hypothetical protein